MNSTVPNCAAFVLTGLLLGWASAQGIPDWYPITFTAELSGAQVVPALEEGEASASIIAVLTGQRLVVTGHYREVAWAFQMIGAAIRQAPPGETGPMVTLEELPGSHMNGAFLYPATNTGRSGTLSATFVLSDAQVQALKGGEWYVEFYVGTPSTAVVRGQLATEMNFAATEFDPDARIPTAEEMAGIWKEDEALGTWQFYADGRHVRLDSPAEAGKEPPAGFTWSIRDGIVTWIFGTIQQYGSCGGQYIEYAELLDDDRLRMMALVTRPDCDDGVGVWTYFTRVEP